MFKLNLKKIKIPKNLFKREYKAISDKARHDWKIMIIFFLLVYVAITIVNFFIFFEIDKGEIFSVSPQSETRENSVNKKLLEETVNIFESKRIKFENLRSVSIPDPSL